MKLSLPQFASDIFQLTDSNREYLRQWLPWLDDVTEVNHTRVFLEEQMMRFAKGEALHATIFYLGEIVGVVGFNTIDDKSKIGYIGYWLAESYNGKGIMSACVSDLIKIGRRYYALTEIDIRCATLNKRSRAIPERLGFNHKETLIRAECLYGRWVDHEVYGLNIEGQSLR